MHLLWSLCQGLCCSGAEWNGVSKDHGTKFPDCGELEETRGNPGLPQAENWQFGSSLPTFGVAELKDKGLSRRLGYLKICGHGFPPACSGQTLGSP